MIADYVKLCSGFLFCGGGDITPLLFGEEPARGIGETDIALDLFQIRLMKSILKSKKPVLAICRGMQILNVACHGTICQDIELRKEPSINHMQTSISRKDISHKVNTVAGSRLHRIIGEFAYTNSFHHQVIAVSYTHLKEEVEQFRQGKVIYRSFGEYKNYAFIKKDTNIDYGRYRTKQPSLEEVMYCLEKGGYEDV